MRELLVASGFAAASFFLSDFSASGLAASLAGFAPFLRLVTFAACAADSAASASRTAVPVRAGPV